MFAVRQPLRAASLLLCVISVCRGSSRCIPRFYWMGTMCCPKCSPGECVRADCSFTSSTKCNPCEDGTYNDDFSELKVCLLCTSCAPDSGLKIASPCTKTRDALCEPLEGFFCRESKGINCEVAEKHSQCKPGQYVRANGTAVTDTVCTDCSAGTFSDGTFTTCRPHTQCENLLKNGTASADAECGEHGSIITVAVAVGVVCIVLVAVVLGVIFLKKKYLSGKRGPVTTKTEETSIPWNTVQGMLRNNKEILQLTGWSRASSEATMPFAFFKTDKCHVLHQEKFASTPTNKSVV